MDNEINDIQLKLEWVSFGQHLKVSHKNEVLYNSRTGIASPLLSARQVKWIIEHYQQKRKSYVFV